MSIPGQKEINDLQQALSGSEHSAVELASPPADEHTIDAYRKAIRQYLLSGKKTGAGLDCDVVPALLSPFLGDSDREVWLPLLYDISSGKTESLLDVLREEFNKLHVEDDALQPEGELEAIASLIKHNTVKDLAGAFDRAVQDLHSRRVDDDETQEQNALHEKLRERLSKRNALLIRYSRSMVFEFLELELVRLRARQERFVKTLKRKVAALKDLLLLAERGRGESEASRHYGFTSGLLSIDDVEGMSPSRGGAKMGGKRLERIQGCLQVLVQAVEKYEGSAYTIFTHEALASEFGLKNILHSARFVFTPGSPCGAAREEASAALGQFVRTMGALKLAELEIDQKYDESLHDTYFEGFGLANIDDREYEFMRPFIVVEESDTLGSDPGDFIGVIAGSYPVKVLSLNRLPGPTAEGRVPGGQNGQELAALAIFRRNAYVFQGAADTPLLLDNAVKEGLGTPVPTLLNILFAPSGKHSEGTSFALLRSAIDSRRFPRVEYDLREGKVFGSHFRIGANVQPSEDFPMYSLDIEAPSGVTRREIRMTIADHLAAFPGAGGALEIVPDGHDLDELVPVAEYLAGPSEEQQGKIPFIWMTDAQRVLRKAVVPISWIQYCRARLEYWQFVQELGGAKSYYAQQAVEKERRDWEAHKEAEIENLRSQLATEFEHARQEDLGKAITNMLTSLLDPAKGAGSPTEILEDMASGQLRTAPPPPATPENQKEDGVADNNGKADAIPRDAWVESALCTSCNDCIDALPSVFKYNADKQAYVHNPKGGPYAKIVAAAEKCPARCIHPGLPQDPDEPGLDRLVKRAEKYN